MDTQRATRFFIYVRKSTGTEDRQVRSIGDQLAEIRELVQKGGFDVVGSFEESQSAMTKGRPFFNEMLGRIEAGEADGIIAWHPDRLARNAFDGGRVIDLIDEGKLRDLRFCNFWFEPSAQGKLMLNLAFGQSKYYSDNLSTNIRRGQRQKVNEGVWSWMAPLGYYNEPKLRTIVVDPAKAPLVRTAFELYGTGKYTLSQLRDVMTAKGLRSKNDLPLTAFRYQHLLRNPFYYGVFNLNGELHEGSHEALVSKGVYDAVQAALARRSKPFTTRFKSYVYRGLLHCAECGAGITMETQKGHNYLRCTKRVKTDCTQPYVREESMTTQIAAVLASVSLPDGDAEWMLAELERERERNGHQFEGTKKRAQAALRQIDIKLDRLTSAYLDAGAFSADEFRKRKQEAINAKRDLLDTVAACEQDEVQRFEPLKRFINGSKQMKYIANRSDATALRKELEKIGSNLRLNGRKLQLEPRGAWKLVVNPGSFAQHETAAPLKGAAFVGENHQIETKWSRGDSNP